MRNPPRVNILLSIDDTKNFVDLLVLLIAIDRSVLRKPRAKKSTTRMIDTIVFTSAKDKFNIILPDEFQPCATLLSTSNITQAKQNPTKKTLFSNLKNTKNFRDLYFDA